MSVDLKRIPINIEFLAGSGVGFLAFLIMEQCASKNWSKSRTRPRRIASDYFLSHACGLRNALMWMSVEGRQSWRSSIVQIATSCERFCTDNLIGNLVT